LLLFWATQVDKAFHRASETWGRRRFMKRLARERKRFIRRWVRDSGARFARAALLGSAFLLGMVAA
jgi:hypothetical protein